MKIFCKLKKKKMNKKKNKKKTESEFDESDKNDNSNNSNDIDNKNNKNDFIEKLIRLFNNSFKIFKGILNYIYQQIIQKTWDDMEKKIEMSIEIFQVIKYHNEAIKYIKTFFDKCPLMLYFENLCNDLSQLYLQIVFLDYYDKEQEKNEYLKEILNKIKEDNKIIID